MCHGSHGLGYLVAALAATRLGHGPALAIAYDCQASRQLLRGNNADANPQPRREHDRGRLDSSPSGPRDDGYPTLEIDWHVYFCR